MTQDLLFFLGMLLLIFAVWVGSGGPDRPISFAGPYLNPITAPGTGAEAYGNPNGFSPIGIGGRVSLPGEASSYRGTVSLSKDVLSAKQTDPQREYVVIRTSYSLGEPVSLAGWKLASMETGVSVALPLGVRLPQAGRVNAKEPVVLQSGQEAIVTTGRSPIGVSFLENSCTGYFEEHQDFYPSLSLSCPTPSQEYAQRYNDDSCLSYVRTIPQCTTVPRVSLDVSSSCEEFVEEELTYEGCVARHATEPELYGRTWRLFLGEARELWGRERDTILLLDAQGKTVDALSY